MQKLNDLNATEELLNKNNIFYTTTAIYNDKNEWCGWGIWLGVGHFEFDVNGMLKNIVTY